MNANLRQAILDSLGQIRRRYGQDLQSTTIAKVLNHLSEETITPVYLSRILNNSPKSVSDKKCQAILNASRRFAIGDPWEMEALIQQFGGTIKGVIASESEEINEKLKALAGTYHCFFNSFNDPSEIRESEMVISYPYQSNLGKPRYEQVEVAYKKEKNGYRYHGHASLKSNCLFMQVSDAEEEIFTTAQLGFDTAIPKLIEGLSVCIKNRSKQPISYRRILLHEDALTEERVQAIHAYLKAESVQLSLPEKILDWRSLAEVNEYAWPMESLKKLAGQYYAYNFFNPEKDEVFRNVWRITVSPPFISITRYGARELTFRGSAHYAEGHVFIQLHNQNEPLKKRNYLLFWKGIAEEESIDELLLLGLGLHGSKAVAGREFLTRFKGKKRLGLTDAKTLSYQHLQKECPRALDFLLNHDNAVFPLQPPDWGKLNERFGGHYLVYYLSSQKSQLVRNRAILVAGEGRAHVHYETNKGYVYKLIFAQYLENKLYVLFKDDHEQRDIYFGFHLLAEPGEGRPNPDYLAGTFSAIALSARVPVATVVLLKRVDKKVYEKVNLGRLAEEDVRLEDEEHIKMYLDFLAANPIKVNPLDQIHDWKQDVLLPQRKAFFAYLKQTLTRYLDPRLKKTHSNYFEDLINIISQLVNRDRVVLSSKYREMFRIFYHDMLDTYRATKCEVYASSLPSAEYFWPANNKTEEKINDFVSNGGKMHRCFFVHAETKNGLDRPIQEEFEVIRRHYYLYGKQSNGNVYITNRPKLTKTEAGRKLFRIISTETLGKLSWNVSIQGDSINRQIIYLEEAIHQEYMAYFQALIAHPATTHVTPELMQQWEVHYGIEA